MMNELLTNSAIFAPTQNSASALFANALVGEIAPSSAGKIPIGNVAGSVSNKFGNKFTRGWLNGHGGAELENTLGSTAFDVRPANYNSKLMSHFRAVVPEYGAPVAGLHNLDVENGYNRTFNPMTQARAEFIPSTWSMKLKGEDPISGNKGPTVIAADDGFTRAPDSHFYAYGQVSEGAEARFYPFLGMGQRGSKVVNARVRNAAMQRAVSA